MPRETSSAIGGGTRITSQPVYSGAERAARPKPKPRWFGALLSNLEEFARGIGPGVQFMAKAVYNDNDRVLGGILPGKFANEFLLDNVGKAVVNDYKTRYAPLAHGDIRGFVDQVATRPLDFALDAATLVTLGGAAVVTAPAKATMLATSASARAGNTVLRGAELLAKSGSLRRAGYVERTAENVKRAAQVYGAASREVRQGADIGVVRGVREVGTKAVAEGRMKQALLRPRKTNIVLHTRDSIVERALGSHPAMVKAPLVGLASRAAAQGRKAPMLDRAVLERTVDEAQKRLQWLSQDELTAWAALHQAIDPKEYAYRLDEEAGRLSGIELDLNRARAAQLRRPEVERLFQKPTPRVARAVQATKQLADEVMQPIMENVVGMRHADLLERRALPERVVAGAYSTTTHPTDLQPTVAAERAGRQLAKERQQRGKLRDQALGDLDRMRRDRERLAARLRAVAAQLLERSNRQDAARRTLKESDIPTGGLAERPMTRAEALLHEPDRVRTVPVPGKEPSPAEVEQWIAQMRRRLMRGQYDKARKELRAWLAQVYVELRYGTSTPTADMKRAEAAAVRSAKARAKRNADVRSKSRNLPGRGDVVAAIDKFGPWDPRVARMVDDAGPYRREYWRMVLGARSDDTKFRAAFPPESLERKLADKGYHPLDRNLNPPGDDAMADVIGEWLLEAGGDTPIADIARGVRPEGGYVRVDQDGARALWERARQGDPDLDPNPTDDDIADGIAMSLQPDDAVATTPTQQVWVENALQAFMQVFERGADDFPDAATEFGRVRGRADLALAEKLGIRSVENGVEPTAQDWARAIIAKVEDAGFDEEYLKLAASIRSAQRNLDELGAWAFRTDRFVPDPEQVDFGTVLEFVPELSPELRAKLKADASMLTSAERATVRKAVRKLEAAARTVERNGNAEAVLRRRLASLEQPGRRERLLQDRAQQLEPMPLRGNVAPDGTKYRTSEFVDPATGMLYRDQGSLATAPAGSYLPHVLPRERARSGAGLQSMGSVKGKPGVAADYTRTSTGELFAAGTYENEAVALLDRARGLIRAKYAGDLYDVAMRDMAMPYDEALYATLGGPREWIIANPAQRAGVAKQVESLAGMFEELKGLLPEERIAEAVHRLEAMSADALRSATAEGRADQLVMIPRAYYSRLVGDLAQSSKLVQALVDRPLDVFRTLVLFSRPAYYVNNIVGQHLLLAVRDPGFLPTYIHYVAGRNVNAARELFRLAASDQRSSAAAWAAVFEKHGKTLKGASAGQVETSGFGALTARMSLSGSRKHQIIAGMLRSPRTANELGAVLSDDIPRQVRFIRLMQPHIAEARRAGFDGSDADIAMRLLDEDPVLMERVLDQTLFDLVDYRGMSPFEKRVIRRIVPFYGWMRGLTSWALELGYNHPAQFLLLLGIPSIVGRDVNAEWNRMVPSWLQGAIRIGDATGGTQRVINTQGLNPLSTLADVAMLTRGALGEDPTRSLAASSTFGQINPYAQTFLAAAFNQGRELGTSYPMLMPGQHLGQPAADRRQWPGWFLTGVGGFAASTPQLQLYAQRQAAIANGGIVSPTGVYQSPWSDYVKSYAGLPIRNVNVASAVQRRRRDEKVLAGEGGSFG